jgi:hypothetical protein
MNRRPVQGNRAAVRRSIWGQITGAVLALAVLSGCGSTRQMLGLDKQTPDEFKIINRAPLSLPPDYALRIPEPGAVRPQEQTIPQRAIAAITGTPVSAVAPSGNPAGADPGEAAFTKQFGADRAMPDIREVVERENSVLTAEDKTFLDSLMFWRSSEDRSPVVDAQREAQRLRENAALGKPVDDGETPTIQKRKKALLEGIF